MWRSPGLELHDSAPLPAPAVLAVDAHAGDRRRRLPASITRWGQGARDRSGASGQGDFAPAPFIGTAIAWVVLGEEVVALQIVAVVLAAVGVTVSVETGHTTTTETSTRVRDAHGQ